jgi:hypothetical protein
MTWIKRDMVIGMERHGDIASLPFLCPINVVISWSKKSNILILASRQPVMMHPCGGEQ